MLWNQDMTFPDTVRAHPLKAKETKKVLNPFDAVAKRKKDKKEKEESWIRVLDWQYGTLRPYCPVSY